MLEVKEHLTTVLEELVGKPQRGSMEALILHGTLLKPFALQTNVTSSRSSVCVDLVLVLVPSC